MKNENPFELYHEKPVKPRGGRSLDWEESALDQDSEVEGFAETSESAPLRSTNWFLVLSLAVVCLIIAGKLFDLQIIQGSHLREVAEGNRLRNRTILAPRGQITDRNGEVVARNTASFSLVMVPADLPKQGLEEEIDKLSQMLALDKNEVWQLVNKSDKRSLQPVPLKENITSDQSILFQTRAGEFYGFSVDSIPIREYPQPEIFSHLLGYTGVISQNEIDSLHDSSYVLNDFIGKSGIELSYEKYLKGKDGVIQTEVDATGKSIKVLGTNDPSPGDTVQLNINKGLQETLYNAFHKISPNAKGAAIAMNPKTGEVLAYVSVPGFNSNLFAPGISSDAYKQLLNDPTLPLFNRGIAGTYPPGSTVKPMVAAAALQENIVSENTIIQDKGVLVVPNEFNPGIEYKFLGWKPGGLGPMTVRSAIAESSDIYFYTVAGGYYSSPIKGLGAEKLAEYYRKFNLGKATGIDLPGEKAGLVADPDWKARYFKNDAILSKWYLGDTYHIGIGQGDMLVTPLQVALWTSTIANDGVGMKPVLVKSILDNSGKPVYVTSPQQIIDPGISQQNLKIVQEGMRQTVTAGSGNLLKNLAIPVAGKTGTSQFDGSDPSRTHAWFTSYAPYDNPQIVITVLVEAGGEGHAAAVPIAKEAYQWCIEHNCFK